MFKQNLSEDVERDIEALRCLMVKIVQALVDLTANVIVEAISCPGGTSIVITVADSDIGKVIGKQGRTARSIRMILAAASKKIGHGLFLDLRQASQPTS
jgi:predicted RNA-binding protein YlqC (UPF0109 family)